MTPFAYSEVPPHVWGENVSDRDKFHPYFTNFSVHYSQFTIPNHFAVYSPDNQLDGACIAVVTPEPELGARRWTINGKWITIGIYRDEGRLPGRKPKHEAISWIRYANQLVITDTEKHQLILGEEVEHHSTNVGSFTSTVKKIINEYTFITETSPTGVTSGTSDTGAWYKGNRYVDFHTEHLVFRLLPSNALLPWSFVKDLVAESSPAARLTKRTLFNVSTGNFVKTSNTITSATNYTVPYSSRSETVPPLPRRFNQRYDELGAPLKLKYDGTGRPIPPNYVDTAYKNNPVMLNGTIDNMSRNFRVFVFDYYGVEINHPDRGPLYMNDLVYDDDRKPGVVNNIFRKADNFGKVYYTGPLFDEFGNIAVGVQPTTLSLSTRRAIIPLTLDGFNHPVKEASKFIRYEVDPEVSDPAPPTQPPPN